MEGGRITIIARLSFIHQFDLPNLEQVKNSYSTRGSIPESITRTIEIFLCNIRKMESNEHFQKDKKDIVLKNSKKFRVLSISGGGSRGIIPSLILMRLEQITGRHVTELFDLFIGTSTGAMINAVLNMPNSNKDDGKKWKYTAKDLLDVYLKEGPIVFESSMWKKMTTINGIYGPKYYTKNRDDRFKAWMEDTRIKDLLSDVVFTSYDMCTKSPVFFKSRKARLCEDDDYMLVDCIKAATAAPTVWSPHPINKGLYMDALYGKNPSMFGLIEAIHHYDVKMEDIVLLSLGTGYSRTHTDPANIYTTGPSFLMEAFNSTINANTMSTMYMLRCLLGDTSRIMDIDIPLGEEHMGITDVSKDHINHMIQKTHEYMTENHDEIIAFAKMLIPESEWKKEINQECDNKDLLDTLCT